MTLQMKLMDVASEIGGVTGYDAAMRILEKKMYMANHAKILRIKSKPVVIKIAKAVVMCDPGAVFINTGSPEDKAFVRSLALKNGEEKPFAMENHTIHYDLKEEQGRITDRTYYMAKPSEIVSSLANRIEAFSDIMKKKLKENSLSNRKLYKKKESF